MKDFRAFRNCWWLALLVALIPLSVAAQSVAPSSEDINQLIAHANSSTDHQKLADYYKVEAQRAEAAAHEHEDMLKAYAENASTHEAMKGHTPEAYCRDMIQVYKREAQLDMGLAQLHERMAKDVPKKLPSTGK